MVTSREIRLAARPRGLPSPDDFTLAERELPGPAPGQVLVRNLHMSVDPYMRSRMNESMIHMAPFRLGAALDGAAVGEVVASRSGRHRPGDLVAHGLGWRDFAVLPGAQARPLRPPARVPLSACLGVLGMPGFTAWYGLCRAAGFRPGETVFVSAAAGAVGSTVGQLVRHLGGVVIGSAGTDEKARWLVGELGFHHAFNYRGPGCGGALRSLAPRGIDLYFDNVGGDHLEAALAALRPHGRVVACGMIAQANGDRPGPGNLPLIVGKRLTVSGFVISDHEDLRPDFESEVRPLVESGVLLAAQTVVHGLSRAPSALIGLLRGENLGKMIVTL